MLSSFNGSFSQILLFSRHFCQNDLEQQLQIRIRVWFSFLWDFSSFSNVHWSYISNNCPINDLLPNRFQCYHNLVFRLTKHSKVSYMPEYPFAIQHSLCIYAYFFSFISMQAQWKKFVRDLERIKKQSSVIHFSMLGMYERECRRLLLCMTAMVERAVRRSS